MGVVFKSDDRTLLPAKRITQYKIPGKSGTYDIADGYDNRQISCTVAFVGAGNAYAGVRQTARAVCRTPAYALPAPTKATVHEICRLS